MRPSLKLKISLPTGLKLIHVWDRSDDKKRALHVPQSEIKRKILETQSATTRLSLPVKLIFYWMEMGGKLHRFGRNSLFWMQNWYHRPTRTAFYLQTSLCIQMSSVLSHFRAIFLRGWKSDHKFHPTQAFATQALPSSHCLWKLFSKLHFRCLLFVSARGEKKEKAVRLWTVWGDVFAKLPSEPPKWLLWTFVLRLYRLVQLFPAAR